MKGKECNLMEMKGLERKWMEMKGKLMEMNGHEWKWKEMDVLSDWSDDGPWKCSMLKCYEFHVKEMKGK